MDSLVEINEIPIEEDMAKQFENSLLENGRPFIVDPNVGDIQDFQGFDVLNGVIL